ncbi:Alternative cytochrome c oxidase subunit 2 [compost metagenome]
MVEKVANINKLRAEKSAELTAKGGTALDPYTFDYLLLCNKICGASHYNMQMKVVVDTPEDYKKWLSEKTTLAQDIKAAKAAEKPAEGAAPTADTAAKVIDTVKTVVDTVKAAVAKVAMK